jgi:hypothetical protein
MAEASRRTGEIVVTQGAFRTGLRETAFVCRI